MKYLMSVTDNDAQRLRLNSKQLFPFKPESETESSADSKCIWEESEKLTCVACEIDFMQHVAGVMDDDSRL